MRFPFPSLICVLHLANLASHCSATHSDGVVVELRIKKPVFGAHTDTPAEVIDAVILADGGLALDQRFNITALSPIENIITQHRLKRATTEEKPKQCKKKCSDGQSGSSPQKNKPSECAPDPEPDKKCDNPDTMVFSELKDGQISKSCRSTPEKDKKKADTTFENTKAISEKKIAEDDENEKKKQQEEEDKKKQEENDAEDKKNQEEEERKRKVRARKGACLALGSVTFLPQEDIKALTDDEIDGMLEPEFDNLAMQFVPAQDLEDYMITVTPDPVRTVATVEMVTAGPPIMMGIMAIIKAAGAAARVAKAAKAGAVTPSMAGRIFSAVGSRSGGQRFIGVKDPLKVVKASPQAVKAAKDSGTVQKILKSETFQECVALGAVIPSLVKGRRDIPTTTMSIKVGENTISIDVNAPKTDNHGSPATDPDRSIVMLADIDEDARSHDNKPQITLQTAPDNYNRGSARLLYGSCGGVGDLTDKITLIQVWGGCCTFYDGNNCESGTGMFAMMDREDGELRGKDNDAIGSYWCTFDGCDGHPL